MKATITLLLLCTGIIAFCSCSDENEGVVRNSSLRITTEIATRSVIESTSFNSGDQIGVFAFDANSTNVRATYINKWDLESDISLAETPTLIYAYYPYTTDCDYQTVRVDIAPDAIVTGQADYLYGKSVEDVSATSPEALIRFKHALARITLSIKRSADDAGYGVLSNVCLQNAGNNTVISTSGWMDVTTGKISSSGAGPISLDMNHTLSSETAQNVDILVIPTAMEKEGMAELALTIDGSQYMVKMPAATWEAGQQYTYPITINRTDAHIVATPAKVGDYYYSDGSWSTEYDANRTCIGIVFALSEEKDGDINVSLSESMHGRIVALEDIGEYAWGANSDVEEIPNYQSTIPYINNMARTYLPTDGKDTYYVENNSAQIPYNYYQWPTEKSTDYALTDYAGKEYTSFLTTENFPAGYACYSYTTTGTSSGYWYLPSCGEIARLGMACAVGVINESKQTLFKNLMLYTGNVITPENYCAYWTSTEHYSSYNKVSCAWVYIPYSGWLYHSLWYTGSNIDKITKENKMKVRPIAAF